MKEIVGLLEVGMIEDVIELRAEFQVEASR